MARSLSGWQGYPNVCYVCGERIYLSGKKAKGVTFGIETSRHPECRPKERWGGLPLGEPYPKPPPLPRPAIGHNYKTGGIG